VLLRRQAADFKGHASSPKSMGNRRDAVVGLEAPRAVDPNAEYQGNQFDFNPFDESGWNPNMGLIRAGAAMMGSQGGVGEGLTNAFGAYDQYEQNQRKNFYDTQDRAMARDTFAMGKESHTQDMAQGDMAMKNAEQQMKLAGWEHSGDGFYRNLLTGETIKPSQDEINSMLAITRAKTRASYTAPATSYQFGEGYDGAGRFIKTRDNPRTGDPEYKVDGKWVPDPPEGFMLAQQSAARYTAKAEALSEDGALDAAIAADRNIGQYDRMLEMVDSAGVGAGVFNSAQRALADTLGMDIGSIDLSDQQQLETELSKLELVAAGQMKGQGQITESERQILRDSMPKMATDPEAFRAVIEVLRNREIEAQTVYDEWEGSDAKANGESFKAWRRRRQKTKPEGGREIDQGLLNDADAIVFGKGTARGATTY